MQSDDKNVDKQTRNARKHNEPNMPCVWQTEVITFICSTRHSQHKVEKYKHLANSITATLNIIIPMSSKDFISILLLNLTKSNS